MISYDSITWCIEICYYVCSIFEVLVIIFFIFQAFKQKSDFKTSFYLILNVDYCISFVICLFWFIHDMGGHKYIAIVYITAIQEWYGLFLYGFCNFLLGLNRCTALAFPLHYKKIWNKRSKLLIFLILIFPFFPNCYNLFDFYCKLNLFNDECFSYRVLCYFQAAILNIILNSFALFFVIYGVLKARSKTFTQTYKAKTERQLVYQSLICGICQIIYYMFSSYSIRFPYNDINYTIFYNIGFVFYIIQRYSNLIIIFIVHSAFRKSFIKFYNLDCFFRFKFPLVKIRVKAISNGMMSQSNNKS